MYHGKPDTRVAHGDARRVSDSTGYYTLHMSYGRFIVLIMFWTPHAGLTMKLQNNFSIPRGQVCYNSRTVMTLSDYQASIKPRPAQVIVDDLSDTE